MRGMTGQRRRISVLVAYLPSRNPSPIFRKRNTRTCKRHRRENTSARGTSPVSCQDLVVRSMATGEIMLAKSRTVVMIGSYGKRVAYVVCGVCSTTDGNGFQCTGLASSYFRPRSFVSPSMASRSAFCVCRWCCQSDQQSCGLEWWFAEVGRRSGGSFAGKQNYSGMGR